MPRFSSLRLCRPALAVAVAAVLLTACGEEPEADPETRAELAERDARITELEAELDAAEERISTLEGELEAARADTDDDAEPEPAETPERDGPAPPRTPEGLIEQLHTYFPPEEQPDEFEPGVTDWVSAEIPEGFGETDAAGYESPEQLMAALVAEQGLAGTWETAVRILGAETAAAAEAADEAQAAILTWGLLDDATAGIDSRYELRQGTESWFIEAAEERFHCRRGVAEDENLCV